MSLTLRVRDHADGTGGTATIDGAAGGGESWYDPDWIDADWNDGGWLMLGGATIKLFRALVTASAIGAFVEVGERVGAGNIVIAETIEQPAYYYWRVEIGDAIGRHVYQPLTPKGDSVYERCLIMLRDKIRSLNLVGLDDAQVYIEEIPGLGPNMTTPCVLLTDFGMAETVETVSNKRDQYHHGVAVAFIDRVSNAQQGTRQRYLHWRNRLHEAIHQKRWDLRVPEVWKCEVQPAQIVAPDWAAQFELRVSASAVICWAKQSRGAA